MPNAAVARMVHYYQNAEPLGAPLAAVVVAVDPSAQTADQEVDLFVFVPAEKETTYAFFVPFSETPTAGHWSWPPMVTPAS